MSKKSLQSRFKKWPAYQPAFSRVPVFDWDCKKNEKKNVYRINKYVAKCNSYIFFNNTADHYSLPAVSVKRKYAHVLVCLAGILSQWSD